jgi:hypothetical protein
MFWQMDSKPVMKGRKFTHRDRMARISSFVLIAFSKRSRRIERCWQPPNCSVLFGSSGFIRCHVGRPNFGRHVNPSTRTESYTSRNLLASQKRCNGPNNNRKQPTSPTAATFIGQCSSRGGTPCFSLFGSCVECMRLVQNLTTKQRGLGNVPAATRWGFVRRSFDGRLLRGHWYKFKIHVQHEPHDPDGRIAGFLCE